MLFNSVSVAACFLLLCCRYTVTCGQEASTADNIHCSVMLHTGNKGLQDGCVCSHQSCLCRSSITGCLPSWLFTALKQQIYCLQQLQSFLSLPRPLHAATRQTSSQYHLMEVTCRRLLEIFLTLPSGKFQRTAVLLWAEGSYIRCMWYVQYHDVLL